MHPLQTKIAFVNAHARRHFFIFWRFSGRDATTRNTWELDKIRFHSTPPSLKAMVTGENKASPLSNVTFTGDKDVSRTTTDAAKLSTKNHFSRLWAIQWRRTTTTKSQI